MDVQREIVDRYGDDPDYLARVGAAIAGARGAGVPVVYVRVAFRPGHPEISPANKFFAPFVSEDRMVEGPASEIHPAVSPAPGDIVVTRRRVSAFTGSELDVVLRARDAGKLVLCGISTSGVVLSTLRQASDLDYELVVLADGCLDDDPEVHRVLIEKVFPPQAEVMTVAEWTAQLTLA
jgi:nicotinamidase-related amidase